VLSHKFVWVPQYNDIKIMKDQTENVPQHVFITFTKTSASHSRGIPYTCKVANLVIASKVKFDLYMHKSENIFMTFFLWILPPELRMNLFQELCSHCRQFANLTTYYMIHTELKFLWNLSLLCSSSIYCKRVHFKHLTQSREQSSSNQ